ncbi:MAG TPA: hypothetical protein VLA82_12595 [Actinomycetota bacterium]|nr:hypothetical protein [Actinomycetota bacterium]
MTRIDDVRKTIETTLGTLTPAKAQQLAKDMLEPDARKEQVAKTTGDLLEWSQRNRQRLRDLVRREIREQLEQVGVASRADLDALKKRVRELERNAGMTASGRRAAAPAAERPKTSAAAKTTTRSSTKTTAAASTSRRRSSAGSSTSRTPAATGSTGTARAKGRAAKDPAADDPAVSG